MAQLTIWQRKRLREYLAKRKRLKELEQSSIFNAKIFSGIKKVIKVGFWFFLLKGIFWLLVLFGVLEIL